MSFEDVIRLNSRVTLQQMLQREDFKTRIDNQQSIRAHEIQYPIMQGWDSVMVKADVELGGTDQLFNILIGRDFQKEEGLPQQVVFLLPILEGLDGSKKMSKSLGNFVAIKEPAAEMFGKLMSISDDLMARYYDLLLGRTPPDDMHPLEAKKLLAFEIVRTYHSLAVAQKTLDEWNTRFRPPSHRGRWRRRSRSPAPAPRRCPPPRRPWPPRARRRGTRCCATAPGTTPTTRLGRREEQRREEQRQDQLRLEVEAVGKTGANATPTPSRSISAGHGSRSRSPTPTSNTAASISPTTRTRVSTGRACQAGAGSSARIATRRAESGDSPSPGSGQAASASGP